MPLLGVFFFFHLWSFDRFKCLRWNQSGGTFKRLMTYSYAFSMPLISLYPIGLSAIKYHEGFIDFPPYGIIPKPIELWSPRSRNFNFPLMICLSVGWSFEIITHLEELCFWLFLLHASSVVQHNWFHSLYFKTWVAGSILAIAYIPIVTILTRSDPLKRKEGADKNIIVRLTKFSELNIFFPRSVEGEIAARDKRKRSRCRINDAYRASLYESRNEFTFTNTTQHSTWTFNNGIPVHSSKFLTSSPRTILEPEMDREVGYTYSSVGRVMDEPVRTGLTDKYWVDKQDDFASLPRLAPNRKRGDVEIGAIEPIMKSNMAKSNPYTSNVNHLVHNFTSPIGTYALVNVQPI
ncbi:hypothetical protein C0993_000963 [Termitomyces sp. T159_Od127]|nr:hypothetical protein C0993_000963 [Termitomyces sp. T159_Od127]